MRSSRLTVPAGAGEGGERARARPAGTSRSPLLTQQQEAEHPLQDGEELEPGAEVPLRGPGCCEQGAQGGLDAGAAACRKGHGTQPKTARVAQMLSQLAGEGPNLVVPVAARAGVQGQGGR